MRTETAPVTALRAMPGAHKKAPLMRGLITNKKSKNVCSNQLSRIMINPVDRMPERAVNCHLSVELVLLTGLFVDLCDILKSSK